MKARTRKLIIAGAIALSAEMLFGAIDEADFFERNGYRHHPERHHDAEHHSRVWRDSPQLPEGSIRRADAEAIAIADAGIKDSSVACWTELDRDDGRIVYEVSFAAEGGEYDYKISADGAILKASWEKLGWISGDRDARLTEAEAKAIVLSAIGENAENISVWEDWDDGCYWYEARANIGGTVYSVEIAGNGEVTEVSKSIKMSR